MAREIKKESEQEQALKQESMQPHKHMREMDEKLVGFAAEKKKTVHGNFAKRLKSEEQRWSDEENQRSTPKLK
ncbi:MAG: hypothetical protein A3I12_04880 [Gammaproteobacteria bacterium RIFCSPLOWO2_02_FULL_38_11]|nr:MAG: hypothetical protein A3I12_04880 [Gammaproteobacteria bacterium RIFCSPLOWO2_02_FULL_38_11]OGT77628.1 MAG: hypothetical protein A3G71_01910 [Gammaproteobacteria bacterium RIFCSPLOWO2_12_FULL_38_14]